MSRYDGGWPAYVPVAQRRAQAVRQMAKLRKKGKEITPVEIDGRKITRTFWGSAWCEHLESFSDFANRLPRGRTYVRNGSVCHLAISKGKIEAIVSGSELYNIKIVVDTLPKAKWHRIRTSCTGQISSLIELLQGAFSDEVMREVTHRQNGLFPQPDEIKLDCDCPDWATMCKHVAAVLYGVGARLDKSPELLFTLRGVNHDDLISGEAAAAVDAVVSSGSSRRRRMKGSLSSVFGVDVDEEVSGAVEQDAELQLPKKSAIKESTRTRKKTVNKKTVNKKTTKKNVKREAGKTAEVKINNTKLGKNKPQARKGNRLSIPTSKAVCDLRASFGMNQAEFAKIMGVSAASVSNWEKKKGTLRISESSLNAWKAICQLDRKEAQKRLKRD